MGFGYHYHNQIWVGPASHAIQYPSTTSYVLNSANAWLGIAFLAPPGGATLNKVLAYASAVAGTLTGLECHIFSDSNGVPGTSLASTSTVTALPTGAAWVEFTGLSYALTGGAQYWIVLKNTTGTPASNYPTFLVCSDATGHYSSVGPTKSVQTLDAGTAWATSVRYRTGSLRLEYSDGFSGMPLSGSSSGSASYAIYSNREDGALFTTPANGQFVLAGVCGNVRIVGSPGSGVQFRLYKGTTLIDTSKVVLVGNIQSTVQTMALFTASRVLDQSSQYRITCRHSGAAGDASNYYSLGYATCHDNADSRACLWLGEWQRTYTTDATGAPPSFAETNTHVPWMSMLLDSDSGNITAAGGGGGAKIIGG